VSRASACRRTTTLTLLRRCVPRSPHPLELLSTARTLSPPCIGLRQVAVACAPRIDCPSPQPHALSRGSSPAATALACAIRLDNTRISLQRCIAATLREHRRPASDCVQARIFGPCRQHLDPTNPARLEPRVHLREHLVTRGILPEPTSWYEPGPA
jgi:hypothetical protein